MTPDVNVVLLDFPRKGNEMVIPNEDGSFTIMINARLSHKGQLDAYWHAIKHIENEDFEKDDVQSIEAIAHSAGPEIAERIPSESFLRSKEQFLAKARKARKQREQTEFYCSNEYAFDGIVPNSLQWFGGSGD